MGSDPETWLTPGVIDGGPQVIPAMLSYVAFDYQTRIDKSAKANGRKAAWIRWGVFVGMAAPVLATPCLGLSDVWLKALF